MLELLWILPGLRDSELLPVFASLSPFASFPQLVAATAFWVYYIEAGVQWLVDALKYIGNISSLMTKLMRQQVGLLVKFLHAVVPECILRRVEGPQQNHHWEIVCNTVRPHSFPALDIIVAHASPDGTEDLKPSKCFMV